MASNQEPEKTVLYEPLPWLACASQEEMARVVEALHRVHRFLAVLTDIDALLLRIAEESRQVARAEASSLLLYDESLGDLFFHIAIGESGDQESLKREIRLKPGQGIGGAAAAERRPINVLDAQSDPRFFRGADTASQFETRNVLAVPMVDRDSLVGVLEVVNKQDGEAFTDLDIHVMEIFSSLAASAVVNARLIEEQLRNERLAAIGQAVTALSHHTKNIVSGLASSADLIDMGLEANNVAVLKKSWPVFKRSTQRISNFVQDMLTFSKPREPVREICLLADLLRDAHETVAEVFTRKSATVTIHPGPAGLQLFVDSQALYRCLLNLLANAADALPPEKGRVILEAARISEDAITIEVRDNGAGVPREDRERIFTPFFSTKGARGTGLGLAVTRKAIEEHGGTITVDTAPEGGACFRIQLPLTNPPERHPLS